MRLCASDSRIVAAWLYGSYVRSDYSLDTSDTDVLLVVADGTTPADYDAVACLLRAYIPEVEATILRLSEVTAGIHPGWSRHFFYNVSRSGIRLYGPDCLAAARQQPLSFDDAYQRLLRLCQRARLVVINPSKSSEAAFWLAKYQRWIPLCLMELLDLAGIREDRLRHAHETFSARFRYVGFHITYPYPSFRDLWMYLEQLVRWLPRSATEFGAPARYDFVEPSVTRSSDF